MRKRIFCLLLCCCLSVILLASCAGKGGGETTPEQTTAAPSSYTVIFSVNGTEHSQTVPAGQVPVFTGDTSRPDDAEHAYQFSGWDRELAPATADVTYTATYRTLGLATGDIRWVLDDGVYTTTVHEGEIPTPPAELKTEIVTAGYTKTFTGWDKELAPADLTVRTIYSAEYNTVIRKYTVSFKVDGAVVATAEQNYGTRPSYPKATPEKTGYHFGFWTNDKASIVGDTVCEAVFTKMDPAQLQWAFEKPLLGFSPTNVTSDNYGDVMAESSSLLYLALEERENPQGASIRDRAVEHLRNFVSGGNEPYFDLEPYWCYCPLTAAIAVCRRTPNIWDQLTELEKEKVDCVMSSFAYVLTLGTADVNNYSTGPGLMGNFGKSWNPNYRLANVTPMIFVGSYFGGAEAVDALLADFDFDRQLAKFEQYGFTRAFTRWSTGAPVLADGSTGPTPKEFMENGGPAYLKARNDANGNRLGIKEGNPAGSGSGVRVKYTYGGATLDEPGAIFENLLRNNYGGGKVINSYGTYTETGLPKAYILTGKPSPVEGLTGMMLEFKSGDGGDGVHGGDIRSSCSYTVHDFIMVVSALSAMETLDIFHIEDKANAALFAMMWVGNTDFIFKYAEGYMSYSLGGAYESHEGAGDGYLLWKTWWNERYGKLTAEDFNITPEVKDPYRTSIDFEGEVQTNGNGLEPQFGEVYGVKTVTDAHSGSKVYSYKMQCTWNRVRFLDLFTAESVGKEYEVTFWLNLTEPGTLDGKSYTDYSFNLRVDDSKSDGGGGFSKQVYTIEAAKVGEWVQYTMKFTYTAEMAAAGDFCLVFNFNQFGQVRGGEVAEDRVYATVMLDDLLVVNLTDLPPEDPEPINPEA